MASVIAMAMAESMIFITVVRNAVKNKGIDAPGYAMLKNNSIRRRQYQRAFKTA